MTLTAFIDSLLSPSITVHDSWIPCAPVVLRVDDLRFGLHLAILDGQFLDLAVDDLDAFAGLRLWRRGGLVRAVDRLLHIVRFQRLWNNLT